MSKVSTAQRLGVVARVATQQAKRSRTMRAATQAAAATGRAFGRVLHQLWLEVTGVVFLVMALSLGAGSVREYGKYHAGQARPGRMALAICCALVFAWFGVSSFWRVKNKRKNGVR
jgi:hypothetical protein